jgi:hypothetical protein
MGNVTFDGVGAVGRKLHSRGGMVPMGAPEAMPLWPGILNLAGSSGSSREDLEHFVAVVFKAAAPSAQLQAAGARSRSGLVA